MLEIRNYLTAQGEDVFGDWLDDLRDRKAAYKIITRIQRLALGNPGDFRVLDGGVSELRLDFGPGYRVYYGRAGKTIILLLCGGDKATQQKDIDHAKRYLKDYQARETKRSANKRIA
jgi:putative addiction module killer protein